MAEGARIERYLETPFGGLRIRMVNGAVTRISFTPDRGETTFPPGTTTEPVLQQFDRYLKDPRSGFDLPLHWQGTPFQLRVWHTLLEIPVGTTSTYGEIARRVGSSARAVGGACRANPLVLVVPCHRVVSAAGLGGFSGETGGRMLAIKRWLLTHEGALRDGA
ncbi:MAG: methylated-DNA--[protein]-cysteine S-methyltransferase [Gammaproteobacteria bacterium]